MKINIWGTIYQYSGTGTVRWISTECNVFAFSCLTHITFISVGFIYLFIYIWLKHVNLHFVNATLFLFSAMYNTSIHKKYYFHNLVLKFTIWNSRQSNNYTNHTDNNDRNCNHILHVEIEMWSKFWCLSCYHGTEWWTVIALSTGANT